MASKDYLLKRSIILHLSHNHICNKNYHSQTVLTGLAPNGGLYIPESIPSLPPNWESDWSTYSFIDLSVAVLSLYISQDEISTVELRLLVEKSYKTFRHPDVTPLKNLNNKTFVLELFHGPTFAFKDVALQLLGNLFEFFLLRRNARKGPGEKQEKLTVVGATSGDTGRYIGLWLAAVHTHDCGKCCDLWPPQQSQCLHFYPSPQRSCIADSRSTNDNSDGRQCPQRCSQRYI